MPKENTAPPTESQAATVLKYLKRFGQLLDSEIATGTGIPLAKLHPSLDELALSGEISRCTVIRYTDGKPVEGIQCRVSGYAPPPSPGRKPGASS